MAGLKKVRSVSIAGFGILPIKENTGEFKASGQKREHKAGANAADGGFLSSNEPSTLKVTVLSHGYISAQTINDFEDQNITVTMADGVVHVMQKAWSDEVPEEKDGEMDCNFTANISEKIS